MTYDETVRYLYTATPLFQQRGAGAYKPGLQTTLALDAHLGHPHTAYPTLHVAGTNGKGSVCHTLAAVLQSAGYNVGLFTSPHLVDFRERIRINGRPVPQDYVVRFVETHRPFFEPLHPSFFELTTALAFRYFADAGVDVAVVEVGLGGRLDCTNILTPLLSVVTNISLDHTDLLGDTLAAIAAEKAGIFKPGVPAVVGEALPETRPVFEQTAKRTGTPLTFAQDVPEVLSSSLTPRGTRRYTTRSFGTLEGELAGDCQEKNANTLLAALGLLRRTTLGAPITEDDVHRGFAHVSELTGLMGRWQTLRRAPRVVCDTGHNVGGWQYLGRQLSQIPADMLHVVFGMAADKDVDAVLALLPPHAHFYWTQAGVRRALPAAQLAQRAATRALQGTAYPDVATAYRAARAAARPSDTIFVGGSSFVVADLLALPDFADVAN